MVSIIGFIILPITALVLYSNIFVSNVIINGYSWTFILQIILAIALLYEMNQERKREISKKYIFTTLDFNNFVAVVGGTITSFTFNNYLGMGSVVATGLVGTIAAIMIPGYSVPIYCGAIVGMASCVLFASFPHLVLLGIIAGLVFVLTKNAFNGFGGKLGAIAITGCILTSMLAGKEFLTGGAIPGWDTGKYIMIYSVIAAITSNIINLRLKHGAVFGSGVVGLLGGLIMPYLYPAIGGNIAIMMICASFAGMTAPTRLPNEIYIGLAGVFSAFFYIYSMPYFGGTGGKLGTIAFISCIIIRGIIDIFEHVKRK